MDDIRDFLDQVLGEKKELEPRIKGARLYRVHTAASASKMQAWLFIRPRGVVGAGRPNSGGLVLGCIDASKQASTVFFRKEKKPRHPRATKIRLT